jgi:hypothetical protein
VHNRDSLKLLVRQAKTLLGDGCRRHPKRLIMVQTFEADSFAGWQEQKGPKVETRDTLI